MLLERRTGTGAACRQDQVASVMKPIKRIIKKNSLGNIDTAVEAVDRGIMSDYASGVENGRRRPHRRWQK